MRAGERLERSRSTGPRGGTCSAPRGLSVNSAGEATVSARRTKARVWRAEVILSSTAVRCGEVLAGQRGDRLVGGQPRARRHHALDQRVVGDRDRGPRSHRVAGGSTTGGSPRLAPDLVERPAGVGDRRRGEATRRSATLLVAQQPDPGLVQPVASWPIIQRERRQEALRSSTGSRLFAVPPCSISTTPSGVPATSCRVSCGCVPSPHDHAPILSSGAKGVPRCFVARPRADGKDGSEVSAGQGKIGPMTDIPELPEHPDGAPAPVAGRPEAREEHREISEQVEDARWRYYVKDAPTISDAEFDALMARLEELETEFPDLRARLPTQKVGGAVSTELPRSTTSSR